ncbi:MAG TPA: hypothetical protein PK388_01515, partial [Kiritimatiellia bacterium]|nr:hypothetical protein [Kiritimatiellia bacterium]
MKAMKLWCAGWVGMLVLASAALGQTRDVTFSVDMAVRIGSGVFNPATMGVDVRGDFNGWGQTALARAGTTTVYSATISVAGAEAASMGYKFYYNNGADVWENDPNRSFNLGPAGTPQVLDTVYFNNQAPVGPVVTNNVTFSVDMAVRVGSGAFDPATMGVDVRGDFNGWGQTALNREGETSIYSATISVATNEGASVGYKFYYHSDVDNWENDPNRTFLMSADPQVLDTVYFNNEEPVLNSLTLAGMWNPDAVGDYPFTLTRVGAVSNDIVLTSSNTNAVTVPAGVTFVSNSVTFNATVVSLTAGSATIVASNAATGVWTDYVVTPVAPQLSLAGPWELFALAPAEYVVNRIGAVGDDVVLSSSDAGVLTVPAATNFAAGATSVTFSATAVGYGAATITASNAASGAWATFNVTVAEPALSLTGPATVWTGGAKYYVLRRNSATAVGASVNLTSTDTNRLTVPATVEFPEGVNSLFFQATGVATGAVTIAADNDDVAPAELAVAVADLPGVLAADRSGNYTSETFVNGANLGTGFGAWDFWNTPATLGDSTAGGGGDLNDTNGVSFRFMGDGTNGYCNARRNFAEALKAGDVLSFTFTYNWVGGNRGVDINSGNQVKFANLINVGEGNAFSVNEAVISTDYTPGAVVYVEIAQKADGLEVYLTRATNGIVNLAYTTNIAHGAGATSIAMYCGGYSDVPENNVNYAIFMNVLRIVGVEPTRLTFTGGTWDPDAPGDYPFELTRSGAVGDDVVLTSDNPAAVTVPAGATFAAGEDVLAFTATVVSVTSGSAKIVASNVASGAWAEYNVHPIAPDLGIDGPWQVYGLGAVQYTLTRIGAVGDEIALSSSDTNVLTVAPTATYGAGETSITFFATGMTYGAATLYATDAVSGATADFTVNFLLQPNPPIETLSYNPATRSLGFAVPSGYALGAVYGADAKTTNQYWTFLPLSNGVDYVVTGTNVVLTTTNAAR